MSDPTQAAPAEIRLIDLEKRFGAVRAVDGVTIDVYPGEFFSLLGPSGCGKTTTLRMIGGFESPTAGRILLREREVTHDPPDKRLGALHLDRIDLRLADLDVHAAVDRDAAGPQAGIAVRQGQPPTIRLDPQQDRIVDDAAVLGGDQHVLALADSALREVATGQRVDERRGVRTGDLDDALDRDVPPGHAIQQRPVLLDGVAVIPGQVHVVVDVVGAAAGLEGLLEERRAAIPGSEVQGR
jgi:energy-coupling factor transporter ATP-binding protein EcfA2